MPATAIVNGMTVVHKASTGISQAFPDVCKTPAPPAPPIPIPYPNIAMSSDAADTASSVKIDGQPIMISTSKYAMSTGDEAGSLFGVVSNKVKGTANPMMYSFDVKAEGKNVFRQLDLMLQNGGSNPTNTPPGPNNQPPLPPPVPASSSKKAKDQKLVEIKWSKTKLKCGDPVEIQSKTENYPDGDSITHVVHKTKAKRIHAALPGTVSSNAIKIDWITVNGPWTKAATKLKVKAQGPKGVVLSSNELEIEKPAEHFERVYVPAAVNRAEVQQKIMVPKKIFGIPIPFWKEPSIVGSGRFVAGEYGYDLSLKGGVFQIHCKMKIVPHGKAKAAKKLVKGKKAWKREIEKTWDKKWKEHRIDCKRGDTCNCPTGCCVFPIRVKCTFVSGGEHVTVNLWPGAPQGGAAAVGANPDWWDQGNWYEKTGGREGNGAVVHAHEFGHSIGMEDEYEGGSTIAAFYDVPGSIMQSGTQVMIQHFNRHPAIGVSIHTRFLNAAKDTFKLIPI